MTGSTTEIDVTATEVTALSGALPHSVVATMIYVPHPGEDHGSLVMRAADAAAVAAALQSIRG